MASRAGSSRKTAAVKKTVTPLEARAIAELEVRRYFDNYLNRVFPEQIKAAIQGHDESVLAHGAVSRRLSQYKFLMIGVAFGAGLIAGGGFERVLGFIQ